MSSEETSPDLTRVQIMRGLRISIIQGIFGTSWFSLTGGVFFTGYALALGASKFEIGLLASLPALTNLIQPLSSIIVERIRRRKPYVIALFETFRTVWTTTIFIPFLVPHNYWIPAFTLLIFLASLAVSMGVPAWTVWISDLVPQEMRGRYFSRRNTICGAVGMVVGVVAGWVIDRLNVAPPGFPAGYYGFFAVFMAAFVMIAADVVFFSLQPERPVTKHGDHVGIGKLWRMPFKDRNFVKFSLFFAWWTFAAGLAAPYYSVFMIETLVIPYSRIAIFTAIGTLTTILTYPFWGFLIDRFGNRPVLKIGSSVIMILPLLWIFNTQEHYFLVPIIHVLGGVFSSAFALSSFNLLLRVTPERNRSIYLAIYSICTGIPGFLAPIIGGVLIRTLGHLQFTMIGLPMGELHFLFLLSSVVLLLTTHFLPDFKELGEITTGQVLRQLVSANPFGVFYHLYLFSKADTQSDRLRMTRLLGTLKSPLAVDDLIRALDDPSQEVRRQAARSLGEIGDRRAIPALIAKLHDPEANIQPQAARALGEIGDPGAVDALTVHLDDQDLQLHVSVIGALGRIGDQHAVDTLFTLAEREKGNHQIFPVVIDALAKLGQRDAVWLCLSAYPEFASPIIKRQLLCSVSEMAGGGRAFYKLIGMDSYRRDEFTTKLLTEAGKSLVSEDSIMREAEQASILTTIEMSISAYQRDRHVAALLILDDLIRQLAERLEIARATLSQNVQEGDKEIHSCLDDLFLSLRLIRYFLEKSEQTVLDDDEVNLCIILFYEVTEKIQGVGWSDEKRTQAAINSSR